MLLTVAKKGKNRIYIQGYDRTMKLVSSVPTPLVSRTLPLAIPMILLAYSLYSSLSFSMYQNFLLSTYEFIVVAKPKREFVFFMKFIVVYITINIVFSILRPPKEDLDDQYVQLDEVKDYTVLEVSDEDYYHYYKCSDYDEDDNEYDSDGYYEDDDDDGSDDDINSDDFYGEEMDSEELQRRAEEFIAKNTRKWREEIIYEKREYMAAIE